MDISKKLNKIIDIKIYLYQQWFAQFDKVSSLESSVKILKGKAKSKKQQELNLEKTKLDNIKKKIDSLDIEDSNLLKKISDISWDEFVAKPLKKDK